MILINIIWEQRARNYKQAIHINILDYSGGTSYILKVVIKDRAGNTVEQSITESTVPYLVDKVNVGDYVAYDAGTWTSSTNGTTIETNRGTSINSNGIAPSNGWRVLSKSGSGSSGVVRLLHAGVSETLRANGGGVNYQPFMDGFIVSQYSSNASKYLNTTYASSAEGVRWSDVGGITTLANCGSSYWTNDYGFESSYTSGSNTIWDTSWNFVNQTGRYTTAYNYGVHGLRYKIVLRAGLGTSDTNDVSFLGQNCWALIK